MGFIFGICFCILIPIIYLICSFIIQITDMYYQGNFDMQLLYC